MDFRAQLTNPLTDARFAANLIAVHGLLVVTVLACLVLRRLLARGGSQLADRTGLRWLDPIGKEAARRGRRLLAWLTAAAALVLLLGGALYHFAGRDIRQDVRTWHEQLTTEDWLRIGLNLASLAALAVVAWFATRALRRLRPYLAKQASDRFGCAGNEDLLTRCTTLATQFAAGAVCLVALWSACYVVGLPGYGEAVLRLLVIYGILAGARLLPLALKAVSPNIAALGTLYLGRGRFHRYWERVARLFPLGERCFELAVYVQAAALAVRELHFITVVADFGPLVVECIGIFFGTRVVIELLQVLLNQLFGLYSDDTHVNQKARTLVPLLNSVCQYVLYFGSAMMMLNVFKINTAPILAGAGIVGLAVGLGAQSLVTDLVSGFFILFESQYLVGDYVQIGDASGVVEAVGIRLTQVRDGHGKLHIIPNGQIKGVVNYSKGYVNAVVDVKAASGSDLESILRAMTEAGRRLRQAHKEVLAETVIHGLVELGASEMTIRAVTKVRPGAHEAMQNEYRRLLKQVFDQGTPAGAGRVAA